MSAKELLDKAIEGVESGSIRTWATSDHNYPIWLDIAQKSIDRNLTDISMFTAYIVCVAIGA